MGKEFDPRTEQVFIETSPGAVDINLELTDGGKEWCRRHIVKLWNELNLPESRQFASLSPEQAKALTEKLMELEEVTGF